MLAWTAYLVVICLVPRSTVHQLALEIMKTRYVWPFPVIQCSSGLNQNVTLICVCVRGVEILDLATLTSVSQSA
jgi:hypothetical protein